MLFSKQFTLWSLVFCLWFLGVGCIRIAGKAGYWKQGAEDEEPTVKQAGFDTQDLTDRNRPPGSIET